MSRLPKDLSEWGRPAAAAVLSLALLPLVACNSFFQCENKPACPTTTTTTTTPTTGTVDYAFVSSTSTAGTSVVTGYNIASGALTAINTVTLPFVPVAMAVNAANTRLYVASVAGYSQFGIYEYTIGTDGSLTAANNGAALVNDSVGTMMMSPDGNYLYTLQSAGLTLTQYTVDTSTGALTESGVLTVPSLSCAPNATVPVLPQCALAVSPAKDFVVAALGTQGDYIFGFGSTTGITGNGASSNITAGTNSGDFSLAIDGSNNLYIAQTGSITTWALASTGNTNRGSYTYPAGSIPRSVVVDGQSKFVYTADVGLGKITGFATGTTTALTVLSGSPYAAPASVAALGVDSTNAYLVAAGYSASAGVQLYAIGTTGVLTPVTSAATSTATQYPVLVAMSH